MTYKEIMEKSDVAIYLTDKGVYVLKNMYDTGPRQGTRRLKINKVIEIVAIMIYYACTTGDIKFDHLSVMGVCEKLKNIFDTFGLKNRDENDI